MALDRSSEVFRSLILGDINLMLSPHTGAGIHFADMQDGMVTEDTGEGFHFYGQASMVFSGEVVAEVWVRGTAYMAEVMGCRTPKVTHVQLRRVDNNMCWSCTDGRHPSREPLTGWVVWNQTLRRAAPLGTLMVQSTPGSGVPAESGRAVSTEGVPTGSPASGDPKGGGVLHGG